MSALASHTVLHPFDLKIPFFPAAPTYLKKQYRAGGLVSFAQAEKFMADYNRWAKRWNEQERAFLAGETNDFPKHDSPDGHVICDLANRSRWHWNPTDGPWLRVSHKYPRQDHLVWEYPLTLVARLKDWPNTYYPKEEIKPEQIAWATWANFWRDGRVAS